ncbi:serine/threonine-protein phosphatase [Corynebacterium aquatimens]
MKYQLNYVALSDRGLVRGNNEDSAYAGPYLLLLADGMGGHAAGEVASQIMVERMEHLDRNPEDADLQALLGAAADDANAAIDAAIDENPAYNGMGTTLTALMFNGSQLCLIHVGDSRGYRLRDGTLSQITVDDTFVQSLVDEGKLAPEDVSTHPQKSLILKAYTGRPVEPHFEYFDAQPGDRYLLCSDGLSDPVTAETIENTLAGGTPREAGEKLIELALRSGGPDNVTVVVADVVDSGNDEKAQLPNKPALAGALALTTEDTHPDTAASRAAALVRPRAKEEKPDSDEPDNEPVEDEAVEETVDKRTAPRWLWPALTLAVVVVMVLGGAWAWMNSAKENRYFISTNEENEFVIEQGFDSSVLGSGTHTPVQKVCINKDNEIRTFNIDQQPADCQVFTVDDLPESARGAVDNLESGDYSVVTSQLERMGQEALPVCVDGGADSCREEK